MCVLACPPKSQICGGTFLSRNFMGACAFCSATYADNLWILGHVVGLQLSQYVVLNLYYNNYALLSKFFYSLWLLQLFNSYYNCSTFHSSRRIFHIAHLQTVNSIERIIFNKFSDCILIFNDSLLTQEFGSVILHMFCQSNFFSSPDASAVAYAFYGQGTGPISLNKVDCVGNESAITDCKYTTYLSGCTHAGDAGVQCVPISGQ